MKGLEKTLADGGLLRTCGSVWLFLEVILASDKQKCTWVGGRDDPSLPTSPPITSCPRPLFLFLAFFSVFQELGKGAGMGLWTGTTSVMFLGHSM